MAFHFVVATDTFHLLTKLILICKLHMIIPCNVMNADAR